ncbi:MAG TPA: hypothetical protein PK887_01605 [Ignavibacteriales bacterium]|jgi:2-hydroxy-3-keto-5-methylthiopentenyl-1-phosphate phosphatase|nr:hypothetical protein [Ignavibacteriales bacterium]
MAKSLNEIINEINNLSNVEVREKFKNIIKEFKEHKIDVNVIDEAEISERMKKIMFETIYYVEKINND